MPSRGRRVLNLHVQQRRKLLKYLKRIDFPRYVALLDELKIRRVETI